MLTFHTLLKLYNIAPETVRLVRHSNKEIPIMEVYKSDRDRFVEYASWQAANKYGDARYIAMFAPGHGTTAIFLGLTYISSVIPNNELGSKHLKMLQQYKLPEKWFEKSVRYQLDFIDTMYDLSERLIIEWGKSTVSWVQKQDKPVIEIRAKHSIGEFISYDDVQLSYKALVQLNNNTNANPTWLNALSSVNGVYLIQHQIDGQMYVGSAYGVDGIWGRWKTYAQTGHGGNKLLKELNPDEFIFSILEIAPAM